MLLFAPSMLNLTPKYTKKRKIELSFLLTKQKQHEQNWAFHFGNLWWNVTVAQKVLYQLAMQISTEFNETISLKVHCRGPYWPIDINLVLLMIIVEPKVFVSISEAVLLASGGIYLVIIIKWPPWSHCCGFVKRSVSDGSVSWPHVKAKSDLFPF